MSKETEYCKVAADDDGRIARWICRKMKMPEFVQEAYSTMGFLYKGRLIGGIIFSACRPGEDVWMTIYTEDKRWCSRRILKIIFNYVFTFLGCRRVSALISYDNAASLNFTQKVGFKKEGLLRQYREDGKDAYILGMLKKECKYL